MLTYLEDLTIRLATGVASLPEATRERHAAYFVKMQRDDGGFGGREGESDLYYTSFALRSLAVLGHLDGTLADRVATFLRGRMSGKENVVDFLSLIYAAAMLDSSAGIDVFGQAQDGWQDAVADSCEQLRRDDGGYAKGPEGAASSTYNTFLVILCLQLIQRPVRRPDQIVEFVLSQRGDEGGFREIRASKRCGTNPTAAAIGTLRILDALNEEICEETIDFLADMQMDEGGLRANTRIPIADLLSTFTAALTLQDLDGLDAIDDRAALRFAQSMQLESGGFHAAAWDDTADVEYSFYGLGCLALLSPSA